MTRRSDETIAKAQVAEVCRALGGQAAGWWRVVGDSLEQVAFVAPALREEVARDFARATRSVPLSRVDLGIVGAVVSGAVKVSKASELPADVGSGYWLRVFAASRSVAVPVRDASGAVVAVLSVALAADAPDAEAVARGILQAAQAWLIPPWK